MDPSRNEMPPTYQQVETEKENHQDFSSFINPDENSTNSIYNLSLYKTNSGN